MKRARERAGGLTRSAILEVLPAPAAARLSGLDVVGETDSTQEEILRLAASDRHARAVLAERQSSGRGRRGRRWHSPPGRNVHLSLGWRFTSPAGLEFLPLVVAVAVADALTAVGLSGHGIKWPNDLLLGGAKLGGCLVETVPEPSSRLAVIGVGINVHMTGDAGAADIAQAWTDLGTHLGDVSRATVAARLLEALPRALVEFESRGFEPFRARWPGYDVLSGRRVSLDRGGEKLDGVARGIGWRGGLLLECGADGVKEFAAGEVTFLRVTG